MHRIYIISTFEHLNNTIVLLEYPSYVTYYVRGIYHIIHGYCIRVYIGHI